MDDKNNWRISDDESAIDIEKPNKDSRATASKCSMRISVTTGKSFNSHTPKIIYRKSEDVILPQNIFLNSIFCIQ